MLWKYILEEKVQQNWQSDCGLIVIEVNEEEGSEEGGFGGRLKGCREGQMTGGGVRINASRSNRRGWPG